MNQKNMNKTPLFSLYGNVLGTLIIGIMLSVPNTVLAAQITFATAKQAGDNLILAVTRNDTAALEAMLGEDYRSVLPLDEINKQDTERFLTGWSRFNTLNSRGENIRMLAVGREGWTLPIPIVRHAEGWRFDTAAGRELMRIRRIGRNELSTMQSLLAYRDAQTEYLAQADDKDGIPEYAQKFISTAGKQDGLFWKALPGEPVSPLGPLFAERTPVGAYHGYFYRILTAQGSNAPGGTYSYLENDNMTKGFAILAWPAQYGDSGVMSFMLSRDSSLYEADLGTGGGKTAQAITEFDPDSHWARVQPGFTEQDY